MRLVGAEHEAGHAGAFWRGRTATKLSSSPGTAMTSLIATA